MQTTEASQRCILAVDLGTSGCRAVLFTPELDNVGEATGALTINVPHHNWSELDANTVLSVVQITLSEATTVARANQYRLAGIVLSGMPSSLVLLDAQGQPLGPCLTSTDKRAAAEAREIEAEFGDSLYERTGCPAHSSFLPAKLRWMQRYRPEQFHRAAHIGSLKEYILHYLTGEWVIDRATAAASGILDTETMQWDAALLNWLNLSPDRLSKVVPTTQSLGLTKQAADHFGLSAGMPVIIGATDGTLANIGSGCLKAGEASCTIGTNAAVRMAASKRTLSASARVSCYPLLDNYWIVGGGLSNGGNVLEWLTRIFAVPTYNTLTEPAEHVPPGAHGLIFLPYLYGERAPIWRSDLRGVIFGLRPVHDRATIVRAALEGVCFSMHNVQQAIEDMLGKATAFNASGGYTHSPIWVQIQADIFGRDITVPAVQGGTTVGAAMLGWLALGVIKSFEDEADIFHHQEAQIYHPDTQRHTKYIRYAQRFNQLREVLAPFFETLALEDEQYEPDTIPNLS